MSISRVKQRSLNLVIPLLLLAESVPATSVLQVSLEEMANECELVFEGRVVGVESRRNASGPGIHTYVAFDIEDVLVGDYQGPQIELRFLGGTVGDMTLNVTHMHVPEPGETGIYFVESLSRSQVHPLYGWSQGHFMVVEDAEGIERVATRRQHSITAMSSAPGPGAQRRLSEGVAAGLIVRQDFTGRHGMTKAAFKQAVRDMVRSR